LTARCELTAIASRNPHPIAIALQPYPTKPQLALVLSLSQIFLVKLSFAKLPTISGCIAIALNTKLMHTGRKPINNSAAVQAVYLELAPEQ